ncbi:hypothetical protein M422DRAFT_256425 [Sphaerobolus stellatus SS14]|uniref:Uncharacterized protein n=1 Tax=Sphaerobolus stellatus (strain SS14) TaxID=990650 RepID=A0A0C9V0X5_SPHS4|nr:hypothetical protein M422DRAFT_256425 [Sphaerobolus stellatus SS14]
MFAARPWQSGENRILQLALCLGNELEHTLEVAMRRNGLGWLTHASQSNHIIHGFIFQILHENPLYFVFYRFIAHLLSTQCPHQAQNSREQRRPLPRCGEHPTPDGNQPPIGALDSPDNPPLSSKCFRYNRPNVVCCKELKDEHDRRLIDPDVVRDCVMGLSDAHCSLVWQSAGAISIGTGGFLASQSECHHYRFLSKATSVRVLRSCDGEIGREVHAILGPAASRKEYPGKSPNVFVASK